MTLADRLYPGTDPGADLGAGLDAGAAAASDVDPAHRLRRTRRTETLRALVRETRIHPRQLVAAMFVQPGREGREPVGSMPGVMRVTPDEALKDARALEALGVGGVILFGLPAEKDAVGTGGWIHDGIVQETLRRFRDADLGLALIADTCLCEYTDHGHCGPLLADGRVDNDATIELYARTAASQAEAGADIVAPSGMMDGQVAAIRRGLDAGGFHDTAILAYAAKTASAFYGPFRDAAGSTPAFGDRRGYQMDPANGRESMREIATDLAEGADMLLVKPAMPSLDILAAARARYDVPIGAYQVSGEFASIEAAAERGWLDRRRALTESTTSILRAGADFVITYAAADLAVWAREAR
jgi:porphobilinogen synthase